jgi:DNA-directed RNA polymerase II subunit RPB1
MRKLTESELEDICSILELEQTVPFDVAVSIHENLINDLRNQLQNILIYPDNIPLLKEKIQKNYVSSRVQPGEMVGCIAASSIGEQNTQASLNSFHSAGIMKANLTDGISRLDELISANKNMKTPSCTFYFKNIDNTDLYQVKRLCNMYVIYHDILACVEKYMIHYKYNFTDYEQKYVNFFTKFYKRVKLTEWSVRFYFQKTKLYNINKTIEDICKLIELKFPELICIFYPENKMYIDVFVVDNILDPSEIIKKGVSYNIEYEEKKDKKKDKKEKEIKECCEYEAEEDIEVYVENIEDEEDIEFLSVEDNNKTLVDDNNKMYFYLQDIVIPSILILPLTGIKNIKECYYNEDSKGKWFVQTKGSNLLDLLTTSIVDFRTATSNNMNEVYQILGIEATKQFITDEFYKIINVSKRHLQILVSAMTFFGTISPVSRYGMNPMAGILTKISFEQPFDNLISSACLGVKDHISGVSSSITIGKLARFGTGMIDVIEDKSKIPEVNNHFDKEIDFEKYLATPKTDIKKVNNKSKYIVRKPTINNIVCEKDKSMSVLEIKSSIIKKSIHNKIEMYDEEIL